MKQLTRHSFGRTRDETPFDKREVHLRLYDIAVQLTSEISAMANNVVHFAIHADDLERAQRFYNAVFGWRFEAWGPPDFFRIRTGDAQNPGIEGALEKRQVPLRDGNVANRGFTCTISVADIGVTRAALMAAGAKIRFNGVIPTVGKILNFEDPEGNLVSAMQYEPRHPVAMLRGGEG